MAIIKPDQIIGKLGPSVVYQLGGKQVIRALPKKYTQTAGTKKTAGLFGQASSMASRIRAALHQLLPFPSDTAMQNRLTSGIFKWLKENETPDTCASGPIRILEGMQFGIKLPSLSDRWNIYWTVTNPAEGLVEVSLPEFIPNKSTAAPGGADRMICSISAVSCPIQKDPDVDSVLVERTFNYNDKQENAQIISLNLPTPKNRLSITVMSLKFMKSNNQELIQIMNPAFMPSAIISAISL